jgi:hypothetical protein
MLHYITFLALLEALANAFDTVVGFLLHSLDGKLAQHERLTNWTTVATRKLKCLQMFGH